MTIANDSILFESTFQKTELIPLTEEEGGAPGRYKLSGKLMSLDEASLKVAGKVQQRDKDNANKRVYTDKLFKERVFKNEAVQWKLQNKMMFGELDHPDDGRTSLNRASHIMTKLEEGKDGEILGEAIILNTAAGKNLQAILEATDMIGASSRGFGKLKDDGKTVEESTFEFKTVDFVAEPSTKGAYVAPVKNVKESEDDSTIDESIVEPVSETRLKEIEIAVNSLEEQLTSTLTEGQRLDAVASLTELHSELSASEVGSELRDSIVKALVGKDKQQNHRSDIKMETTDLDNVALQEQISELTEEVRDSRKYANEASDLRHNLAVLEQALDEMASRYRELESGNQENVATLEEELRVSRERETAAEELLQEQLDQNKTINEDQTDLSELQARYDAAEELLDAFIERAQEETESYNELHERYLEETENSDLQARYDAAEELLDAFIERAQEDKEQIDELQERYDAAETLLDESLKMKVEEKIEGYVEELTKGLNAKTKEALISVLNECETREEVDAKYAKLAPLVGRKVERLPLPESGGEKETLDKLEEEVELSDETGAEQLDESQHPEAYTSFSRMKKQLGIK